MFPVGSRSLRVGVAGEEPIQEALSGWISGAKANADRITVEPVSPETLEGRGSGQQQVDCLVIDADHFGDDSSGVVEEFTDEHADVPVVVLVGSENQEVAVDALSAGATETLPRRLIDDPALLGERITATTERDHARAGFRELYDGVAGVVTLHDPDTGAMLHANRTLCEILGYEREELLSMGIDGLVADTAGHDYERAREIIAGVTEGDGPTEIELPLKTADGSVRWVESQLDTARIGSREVVLSCSVDITERTQLEQTYRDLFENVADGLVVHDRETGEIRDVNEQFCEMNGYTREELVGASIDTVTPPDDTYSSDAAQHRFQQATHENPQLFEWRNQRKDGEEFPVEINLRIARIRGNECVLASVRDITERKRRERALKRERDRRSILFESNPDPIIEVEFEDGKPTITAANSSFEDVFGFDADSIGGRKIADALIPDEEQETYERLLERTVRGETVEAEVRRKTAEGVREFLFRAIPFDTAESNQRAYVWYTDITDRKRRERELEEERERYSTLVEQSSDGVAVVRDGEYAFVNDRLAEISGYDREELLGRPVESLFVPEYRDLVRERHERRVAGDTPPTQYDAEIETPSGDRLTLELAVSRIRHEGEPAVMASFRDVTERKRREEAIRTLQDATEEMQDAQTAEEVAERAVEATGAVLDLPLSACWFHDENSQRLEPAAATEEVVERGLFSPLSPGDYEYEAFREGAVTEFAPSEVSDQNQLETTLLLPLGEHGLIAAGHPDEIAPDDVVLEVARTLAEHTETALDRVERGKEVRESERRFRLIAEHIDEVIFLAGPEFSELEYVNPAYEELWGRPVEELFEDARAFLDGIDPRDRDEFEADFAAMLADVESGEPADSYEFEFRIRRPDGEVRWAHANGYPVELADSERRYVGIVEDITERKRREREYEQIFDGVNDCIAVHDPETGDLLDINATMCELTGYDRATILERGAEDLLVDDPAADFAPGEVSRIIDRVMAGEDVDPYEQVIQTSDDEHRWLEVNPTRVVIGGEERFLAISRDVTERKHREREYQQIFDGVTDAITIHDPETGEILDLNETMSDLTGYDPEELLSEGMETINVPEEGYGSERARRIIRAVMDSKEPRTLEWLIERKDGTRRWLEINATPAVIGGQQRYVSIMRDVTEQRRTRRRLGEILDRIDEAIFMTQAEEITAASRPPEYVSSGYEEIWGQSLEEIRETYDNGFFDTLHPEDRAEHRAFVEGIVDDIHDGAAADRYSREFRIERHDGEVRWVQADYYPTRWESGPPRVVIVSRDVTDRKARERRIASFDEATEGLTTADTPEKATQTAVSAATETLGLPAVGAFLYDGEEGVLRPEVVAGPIPEEMTVGPDDGSLWDAFATGTIVASDGGTSTEAPPDGVDGGPAELDSLEEWRGITLGNHGVLVVGSVDSPLDSDTVQAAHVLAATLEAALNHLQGQEQLAAQEEQLQTQTERADRLDRIVRLSRQVEAAITEASEPGEIERAVCERLASAGPYEVAWIGGIDVGTDRITPRAVVGTSAQYVDSMNLTTRENTTDAHPAVRAWQTDTVQVVDSLVGDGPTGAWRQQALSEGHQSLCAVPLTYDGITYGVLTVVAESPNVYDERIQDLLAQLGASVGHALAAIERRRALESDETIELEFGGEGVDLPFARAARRAGCRVQHERTVAREDGVVSVYFSFEGEGSGDVRAVASRTLPGDVDVVTENSSSILVEARTEFWFGSLLAEYGAVLRKAATESGETTVVVELPTQADVRSFTERLQELAPALELVAKRQHQRQDLTPEELSTQLTDELTDRQLEVLKTALSAGYFEWPRENDGSEVADRLGITQPTLNKHLRLAEQKTFELLFRADG